MLRTYTVQPGAESEALWYSVVFNPALHDVPACIPRRRFTEVRRCGWSSALIAYENLEYTDLRTYPARKLDLPIYKTVFAFQVEGTATPIVSRRVSGYFHVNFRPLPRIYVTILTGLYNRRSG